LAITLVGLLGFGDAVVQGSIYGLAGQFHSRFVGAVMVGNGVAGTAISILRIITKVSVPETLSGNRLSTIIYFGISSFCLVICILMYGFVISKSPVTKHYMEKSTKDLRTKFITNEETPAPPSSLWDIFKKIWPLAIMVGLNFFVTLALFPGITAQLTSTHPSLNNGGWFVIIIITGFNVFDLVGRTIPKWESLIFFNKKTLWIPIILRFAFFPLFILSLHPKIFTNDMWMYFFMAAFALTNGYCATLAMMFGPEDVEVRDRERAGTMMVFFLTTGLTAGVWMGTALDKFVQMGL